MVTLGLRPVTFEEYARLNTEPRYELVKGRLVTRGGYDLAHGRTKGLLIAALGEWANGHPDGGFFAPSLDIPFGSHDGRCPDVAYYDNAAAGIRIDWITNRVLSLPSLVVEVTSPGFEHVDWIDKRQQYAAAGIEHYWIVEPQREAVTLLRPIAGDYRVEARFSGDDVCTSDALPGAAMQLERIFDPRLRTGARG